MGEQVFNLYTTTQGETWDLIAFKIWGDERFTSHLQKINLELNRITIFPAGIILKVPIIEEKEKELPPWVK